MSFHWDGFPKNKDYHKVAGIPNCSFSFLWPNKNKDNPVLIFKWNNLFFILMDAFLATIYAFTFKLYAEAISHKGYQKTIFLEMDWSSF